MYIVQSGGSSRKSTAYEIDKEGNKVDDDASSAVTVQAMFMHQKLDDYLKKFDSQNVVCRDENQKALVILSKDSADEHAYSVFSDMKDVHPLKWNPVGSNDREELNDDGEEEFPNMKQGLPWYEKIQKFRTYLSEHIRGLIIDITLAVEVVEATIVT